MSVAKVLLGVSGGIAAYKACELTRLLVRAGHEVTPILTPEAETFVSAKTFEALARREMPRELYPHLVEADLLVVAPLSANTLAKLAHGLADNVLTQTALAFDGPVVAAPAMNPRMWCEPGDAGQRRDAAGPRRRARRPGGGRYSRGRGRGGADERARDDLRARFGAARASASSCAVVRVLVTAGGTREPLDAVRFLGNRSSGRMGAALAAEARRRGAEVTLVASNLSVRAPVGVDVIQAPTAEDVARETLARGDADVVLMAAAVADYRPAEPDEEKRAKDGEPWLVTLEPTTDVLRELGERRTNGQLLIGFAADRGERGLERAREKLANKRADLIVFNDVARDDVGFDALDNEVVLVSAEGERRIEKAPKERIAAAILDEVAGRLEEASGRSGR